MGGSRFNLSMGYYKILYLINLLFIHSNAHPTTFLHPHLYIQPPKHLYICLSSIYRPYCIYSCTCPSNLLFPNYILNSFTCSSCINLSVHPFNHPLLTLNIYLSTHPCFYSTLHHLVCIHLS